MLRTRVFEVLPLVLVLLILVGAPGCWNPFAPPEDDDDGGEVEEIYRNSKMNLIAVFALAHEKRNIQQYADCLHNEYLFWFWEDEISIFPTPWIDRSEDIEITGNMFGAEQVTSIRVDFLNQTEIPGAESDEDRFNLLLLPNETGGVDSVYWGDFLVDMHVVDENGEEVVDHWVDGKADIYVARDPKFPDLWAIWQIKDRGNEHKSFESLSWGGLKRDFR